MAPFISPGDEPQQAPSPTALRAPSHIILDTRLLVRELRDSMMPFYEGDGASAKLINIFWHGDMEKILPEVVQIISFKKDAELSLQYESMQIVQEAIGEHNVDQVVAYARFLVNLGMHLSQHLQRAGAYQNGILKYTYKCMHGDDIVLEHVLFNGADDATEPPVSA